MSSAQVGSHGHRPTSTPIYPSSNKEAFKKALTSCSLQTIPVCLRRIPEVPLPGCTSRLDAPTDVNETLNTI